MLQIRFADRCCRRTVRVTICSAVAQRRRFFRDDRGAAVPVMRASPRCCGLPNTRQTSPCSIMRPRFEHADPIAERANNLHFVE